MHGVIIIEIDMMKPFGMAKIHTQGSLKSYRNNKCDAGPF